MTRKDTASAGIATLFCRGQIYLAQNKLPEAEKQAVEAGHESGNDETVLFTLGRVYLAEGYQAAPLPKASTEALPRRSPWRGN